MSSPSDTNSQHHDPAVNMHDNLRIGLLRCAEKPAFITWDVGDLDQYFEDDRLLISGFGDQGCDAQHIIWRDPSIDWTLFDMVIIRSTWDYIDHCEEFLNLTNRIESSGCRLLNNSNIIRWNIDKIYLLDLQDRGIPVVPTFLASEDITRLAQIFVQNEWDEAIIKPRIGGGASHIRRIPSQDLPLLMDQWPFSQRENYLVQPMLRTIISEGEYSFVYLGGKLSYVHLKKPAAGDFRVQGIYGGSLVAVEPRQEDVMAVDQMMSLLPFSPLYARVDVVRMMNNLVIMELELIEPILNFHLSPKGVDDFVKSTLKINKRFSPEY